MSVDAAARIGGIFSLLAFVHFASDWIFQTHLEAMAKATNARIRARHCLVYSLFFVPVLWILHLPPDRIAACAALLFLSHFVEDTYFPVFLWMRYVRRPPGMAFRIVRSGSGFYASFGPEYVGRMPVRKTVPIGPGSTGDPVMDTVMKAIKEAAAGKSVREIEDEVVRQEFLKFVETPLGKILLIAVDQIVHLAFLLPIAWAATLP